MEVLLSEEVIQSFSALQCGLSDTNTDGFLIGHKRGDLFFIEKIFPSQKGFFSSDQKYFAMKQNLDDKILGFYSFQTTDSKLKKILAPIAYGKIFLRLDRDKTDQWVIIPYAIEHDQDFFLLPIELKSAR
ncbi:MAG: hypothetical protein V3S65_11045 [Candidatus Aminicenantaceae bacterium]|jgi:hypothetical protein